MHGVEIDRNLAALEVIGKSCGESVLINLIVGFHQGAKDSKKSSEFDFKIS
jgi:hypothetical protein